MKDSMWKRVLVGVMACVLVISAFPVNTLAANTTEREVIYQDGDITIVCETTVLPDTSVGTVSRLAARAKGTSTKTKTVTKKAKITNKWKKVGEFCLNATFSYNGKTAKCTNASYSASITDSKWRFTSKSASKSGNKAIGSYEVKSSKDSNSRTITITCDKSGNIS